MGEIQGSNDFATNCIWYCVRLFQLFLCRLWLVKIALEKILRFHDSFIELPYICIFHYVFAHSSLKKKKAVTGRPQTLWAHQDLVVCAMAWNCHVYVALLTSVKMKINPSFHPSIWKQVRLWGGVFRSLTTLFFVLG